VAAIVLIAGSLRAAEKQPAAERCSIPTNVVRPAAVAGSFYPADPKELAALVDRFLSEAKPPTTSSRVRAVIAPHAGYVYSGPIAGSAFATVKGQHFEKVIVLAPSHYAAFRGIAVTPAHYETPLGRIELHPLCDRLANSSPFSYAPPAELHLAPWQKASGNERPDTFEHALEVELPFLQRAIGDFRLVPLICGEVDPEEAANKLAPLVDEQTLLVASSDLSHYYPYDVARKLDSECVRAICALDTLRMRRQEACGKTPILILMYLAKQFGWKPVLLDYRNSGDTAGDKSRVVGYAAVAFYEETTSPLEKNNDKVGKGGGEGDMTTAPEPRKDNAQDVASTVSLSADEGRILVKLARSALEEAVRFRHRLPVDLKTLPPALREPRGCFVTLTKHGELRGCIGHIFPQEPLCQAVVDNAWAAALDDPRFPPVLPYELPDIRIEVSVLTVPRPLAFSSPDDLLAKLRPYRDGVVLKIGLSMATFLPQVWEQLPSKEDFLAHLSRKAGCAPDAWRGRNVSIMIYEVQAFHESEHQ
jgi:AmmeMemoRadiSam system protein B/AmmeMemoRadiSam system protein A